MLRNIKLGRRLRDAAMLFALLLLCAAPQIAQSRITDLDPTVILISIDGFRWDLPEQMNPPEINKFISEGTRARYMEPAYPTKTFPNHYTIVTGLFPGNHGLFENNMLDVATGRVFGLNVREEVSDGMWWGGEPIWNSVQKQGKIGAAYFWPGSEAKIGGTQPRYWLPYKHETPHEERVDTVLSWLDKPKAERPVLITTYFSDVDDNGHDFGPLSAENRAAVMKVDASIGRLQEGLKRRGILEAVNIILVSDHGMSPYTNRGGIALDEMFDVKDAERIFWIGEFTQVFPKPGLENKIYNAIRSKLKNAKIYRKSELPERWRLQNAARLAPLVVVPNEGYFLTSRSRLDRFIKSSGLDKQRGAHGFDNRLRNMRAFFAARGPRFIKGRKISAIRSVDVYNVMCEILGVTPAENDGDPRVVKRLLN